MIIKLTKFEPRSQTLPGSPLTSVWVLSVSAVVSEAPNVGNGIFVYQVSPVAGLGDQFAAVCSVPQLFDMPAVKTSGFAYYRGSLATFLCRSLAELTETWEKLKSDCLLLVRDYAKMGAIEISEVVDISPTTVLVSSGDWPVNSAQAITIFNADKSKLLVYNAQGDLIGEVPVFATS